MMASHVDPIFVSIVAMIVVHLVMNTGVAVQVNQGTLSSQVVQQRMDHVPKRASTNVARKVLKMQVAKQLCQQQVIM